MALFNKEAKSQPQSLTERIDKLPEVGTVPVLPQRAYLDSGSKISGKLLFEGVTRIDGQIDGEITAKESLIIGESAVITAQIKASAIIIGGKVSGDITATQRLEIRPSARVIANLTSPVLVVHEGAMFEGNCSMPPQGAREEHKLAVLPREERIAQAPTQKQA